VHVLGGWRIIYYHKDKIEQARVYDARSKWWHYLMPLRKSSELARKAAVTRLLVAYV